MWLMFVLFMRMLIVGRCEVRVRVLDLFEMLSVVKLVVLVVVWMVVMVVLLVGMLWLMI